MEFFLRLRAWQVFFLFFIIPFLFYLCIIAVMLSTSMDNPFVYLRIMLGVGVFFFYPVLAWYHAVGTYSQRRIPKDLQMDTRWFRLSILYTAVYLVIFFAFAWYFASAEPSINKLIAFACILPFHLLVMAAGFYDVYFISKSLALVEKQQPVSIADWILNVIFILYFPIGVWFLQPKINRLASE